MFLELVAVSQVCRHMIKQTWVWLSQVCHVMLQVDFVEIWRVCQYSERASVYVHRGTDRKRVHFCLASCQEWNQVCLPASYVVYWVIIVSPVSLITFVIHSLTFQLLPFWIHSNIFNFMTIHWKLVALLYEVYHKYSRCPHEGYIVMKYP